MGDRLIARCRPNRRSVVVALLAAALALCSAALAQDRPSGSAPFTPEERARLRAGELVRRPATRREGNGTYVGGTSWQRVAAPRERVWQVITDVRNYPRLIPAVDRAEIVEDHGTRRVLYLRHAYSFVHASYHARVRIERSSFTIRFELDRNRPHDVRDGRGFIALHRYGRNETMVTWGVMADVGSGIVATVFAPVIHDWILRVPFCVQRHVERRRPGC